MTPTPSRRGLLILLAGMSVPFQANALEYSTDTTIASPQVVNDSFINIFNRVTVTQTGGSISSPLMVVGDDNSTRKGPGFGFIATYILNGGDANLGTMEVGTRATIQNGNGGPGTRPGVVVHNGGNLTASLLGIGNNCYGTYHFNGGTLNATQIRMGLDQLGVLRLNGGTVSTSEIYPGDFPVQAIVHFNGATVRARDVDNAAWIRGVVTYCEAGGAKFDTNVRNMGLTSTLSHGGEPTDIDGGLTKLGAGTLTLSAANNHNGGNFLVGGTLAISNLNQLGQQSGRTNFNGGVLGIIGTGVSTLGTRLINDTSFNGGFEIYDPNLTFNFDRSISGAGAITKYGPGNLFVSGTNTHSGGNVVSQGYMRFADSSSSGTGLITLNGGGIRWEPSPFFDISSRLRIGSSNGTIDVGGSDVTFASDTAGGTGTLIKAGTGMLTLTGASTNTGGVKVASGILQVGNGGTTGSITGNAEMLSDAKLLFNRSNNFTYGGVASGAGTFVKQGGGNLTLPAISTHANTIVDAGTLTLGTGGQSGTVRGNLTINNGGTVSLTATNALGYVTGQKVDNVTLNGGSLSVPASASATDDQGWAVAYTLNGGTLSSNGGVSSATATSKFSFGHLVDKATSVKVTADSSIAGRVHLRIDEGILNTNFTVDPGATLTVGAAMTSGGWAPADQGLPAGFTKLGGGTMRLDGANAYTGDTVLAGGTLALGHTSALGTTGKVIFNGGTLQFTPANSNDCSGRFSTAANQNFRFDTNGRSVNFGTVIASAGGSLTKSGDGSLKLSALNTYTGTTTVDKGTLELGTGGPTGCIRGNLTVNSGATLLLTATNAFGFFDGEKVNNVTLNNGTIAVPASASATLDQGWGVAYTLNGGTLSSNGGTSSTTSTSKFAFGGPTGVPSSVRVTANSTIAGHVNLRTVNGNPNTDFTVDAGSNLLVTAGVSSDAGTGTAGFRKLGAGTMTLNGNATYTGATQVKQGLLEVNGILGNTPITVSSGATLGGLGAVSGPTAIESGGRLAFGSPDFRNGLSLAAGSVIDFKMTEERWVTIINSTISGPTSGKITLNLSGPGSAGSFIIVNGNQNATFSNLTADSFVIGTTIPGFTFSIVQVGKTIQLTSVAIPAYDLWSASISDPAKRGRADDPDGDGFTNLEEYLFGTSPTLANGTLSRSERTPDGLMISWLQRSSGATYQLQESSDFSNPWPASTLPVTDGDQNGVAPDYTRKQVLAPMTDEKGFFRIQGSEN